jgi:hypothetical protein
MHKASYHWAWFHWCAWLLDLKVHARVRQILLQDTYYQDQDPKTLILRGLVVLVFYVLLRMPLLITSKLRIAWKSHIQLAVVVSYIPMSMSTCQCHDHDQRTGNLDLGVLSHKRQEATNNAQMRLRGCVCFMLKFSMARFLVLQT